MGANRPRQIRLLVRELECRTVPTAGALDPSFGSGGKVWVSVGPFETDEEKTLTLPTGKLFLVVQQQRSPTQTLLCSFVLMSTARWTTALVATAWLLDLAMLQALLKAYPAGEMEAVNVNPALNKSSFEGPECLEWPPAL